VRTKLQKQQHVNFEMVTHFLNSLENKEQRNFQLTGKSKLIGEI